MLLFLFSVVGGIAVGLFFGGSLSRLARFPLRYTWLILVAILVQIMIFSTWFERPDLPGYLVPGLYVFSFLLLLTVVGANLTFAGIKIIGLGLLLNFLVVVANGGFMPTSLAAMQEVGQQEIVKVLRETGRYTNTIPMTSETRLNLLGDGLIINIPMVRYKVFSIGDTVIAAGALILVSQAMVWRRKRWDWG